MAAITRLNIVNPAANTNTIAFTSTGPFLVAVIATNKSTTTNSSFSVWIAPGGTDTEGGRGYIAANLPLTISNTYETIRFVVNATDVVRVQATTADVSFTIVGIDQTDAI